jgi:serine/threonine protein phosphatase 1
MFIEKKNNTRRLVISDIHGCLKTFAALIEKVNPGKSDQLFFLGDYIDKGPSSDGVIDYLLKMISDGYILLLLKGNHEENLLSAYMEYDKETFVFFVRKINKNLTLLDVEGRIKAEYMEFFRSLNYYFETDSHLIVHAGFNFNSDNPFEDRVSMVELRNTEIDKAGKFIRGKTIVHGHQVTSLEDIFSAISERKQIIPLDNGCFYTKPHKIYDITRTGNLCCLDIDSYELILQKNIDG